MPIIVEDAAFSDPRFRVLGRGLRCSAGEAAFRLMALWSHARRVGSARLRQAHIAVSLRCKPDRVAEVLAAAELGDVLGDGSIELCLDSVFGPVEDSRHAEDEDQVVTDRNLHAEVVQTLGRAAPLSRRRLRERLKCRAESLGEAVRALLEAGSIVEAPTGLMLAFDSRGVSQPVSRETPQVGIAETLSPAHNSLALSSLSTISTKERERYPTTVSVSRGSTPETPRESPREALARELYTYWCRKGAAALGESWRPPDHTAGVHRVITALGHPELAQRSAEDLQHGIDMLVEEALAKMRAGMADPGGWLARAWSPKVLGAACEIPNAEAARARAQPGSQSGVTRAGPRSVPPTPHEVFVVARGRGGAS